MVVIRPTISLTSVGTPSFPPAGDRGFTWTGPNHLNHLVFACSLRMKNGLALCFCLCTGSWEPVNRWQGYGYSIAQLDDDAWETVELSTYDLSSEDENGIFEAFQ